MGKTCKIFLEYVHGGKISGVTSVQVLNEVYHTLMLSEIASKFKISSREALNLAKRSPDIISALSVPETATSLILNIRNLDVIGTDKTVHLEAIKIARKYGLFISDATHAAVMGTQKIENIATNDPDFERIEGIKVWKP